MNKQQTHEQPAGVETRHVFLDTGVFRSFGHSLDAKPIQLLGRYVVDGVFVLHTTDITLGEVRRQIEDMERKLANEANKVAERLDRWNSRYRHTDDWIPVPKRIEPSEVCAAYRDFERTVRQDWKARVHAASDLSLGPVLHRYFARRAPFDEKGSKEFPDAFALRALEEWCVGAQERVYVVADDKAMLRAAEASEHLIAAGGLDSLLALVASADGHAIADAVRDAFDGQYFCVALQDALARGIGQVGGVYVGDRYAEGYVLTMAVKGLEEVADVTILRVDKDQVACVADASLAISAEVDYTDMSEARWDREDQLYYGAQSGITEIRDVATARIFVELERNRGEFELGSVGFLSQDLEVLDGIDD